MKLTRKQVSIFPTQHGFLFLAILISMMLGAFNYNNNAGFILVFLLGGMALISIFHSFKNIVGIEIQYLSPLPVFAGQTAIFPVQVKAPATLGRSITFSLADHPSVSVTIHREKTLQMGIPALDRGLLHPESLTLKSVYPFGLFTFQSTLPVAATCLVYPRPLPGTFGTAGNSLLPDGEETTLRQGPDDFQGLKQYQPGHSINRISWKALSRGRGMFIKDFTAEDTPCVMLDFDAIPGKNVETKLSRLCDMVLVAEGRQMEYGLRLPGFVKNPAKGDSHQHQCLKALAVFDFQDEPVPQNGHSPQHGPILQHGPRSWGRDPVTKESATVIPIICALVVAIAPHTPGLPLWINAWCLVMWGYMLIRLKTRWPIPGTYLRYGLTFTGIAGLLLTYRVQLGADAFVGLLALMAAVKPFEMATHRHQMITLLLTYFIIITSLFRSESMFIVLYMFFSVLITTMALVRVNAPRDPFRESVLLAGKILAQAIPLMILLFLFFPRLPGSLFGIQDKTLGKTGFSDRLSPGSVTRMSQDHTPAFRAEFKGPRPLASQLYWKGIVFQKFDGQTWMPGNQALSDLNLPSPAFVSPEKAHTYTILLEPHNSVWLMALDRPVKGPNWADLTPGNTLKSRKPVKQKIQYEVTSLVKASHGGTALPGAPSSLLDAPDSIPSPKSPGVLVKEMAANIISAAKTRNPRARALARTIVGKAAGPTQKIQALLAYFKKNQFTYTLNPPRAREHPVDSLLFESKQGYCEHFASAFAFMMNVLEVPARIVGGYLGGELNPYGNYLTIRNSYAHAWVEVYDPENGWIRVDPTMAVAPERMETNPDGSSTSLQSSAGLFSFSQKLTFALDAANMRWEAWFTGYSYLEQKALLEKIGLGKWIGWVGTPLVLALVALAALAGFSGALFWLVHSKKKKPTPVKQAYGLFCRRLGKLGLVKHPHQGPMDFAKISSQKRPDLKESIMAITNLYIQLRFQKNCPDTTLAEFKYRTKNFNPKLVLPSKTPLPKDSTH